MNPQSMTGEGYVDDRTTPPLICVRGVGKAYQTGKKTIEVLTEVSLDVAAGETQAVVGASGAGKSTLLNVIGALDVPDCGSVTLMGVDIYSLSERRRSELRANDIGFVFQSYHLLPEMNVLENVMLPGMAVRRSDRHGFSKRKRALELLDAVRLVDRADHTPLELSGGEMQRTAIARALLNDPMIVLADEPTGNLDTSTGQHVLSYLFSLTKDLGHTLMLVTHDEDVARSCDSVIRLDAGSCQRAGKEEMDK